MNPLPIKRIILAVILGIITTITIAWGCAIWTNINPPLRVAKLEDIELDELDPDFPAEWVQQSNNTYLLIQQMNIYCMGLQVKCTSVMQDTFGDLVLGPDRYFVINLAGWPFRAFECKGRIKRVSKLNSPWKASAQWDGALISPVAMSPVECFVDSWFPGYTAPIPYHPLWSGLIINISIFTLAWSILLLGPGTLRHYLRQHQNRCTTCGYNLHNLKSNHCPECGTTITPTTKTK